jgi:hypothetical protein
MCPACIGTALWLLSGAGSAGGLAATLKLRSVRRIRSLRNRYGIQPAGRDDSAQETAECATAGLGATASPMTHPR